MQATPDHATAHAAGLHPLAHRLGFLGLVPFVLGAALAWLVADQEAHEFVLGALCAYGAVIASFLGAIHWGLAMRGDSPAGWPYGWGVTPSLFAWVATLMQPHAGLVIQGVLLAACYLVDRRQYPLHGMAQWLTLRFRLTVVACLCCFVAAATV